MTTFDEREQAFERKFIYDEELKFKALARRNKRLGLWAAEKLGRTGSDADSYAKALMAIDFRHHDEAEIARRVYTDFHSAGVLISELEIQRLMQELLAKAIDEIKNGR
jgi:hypothetical protein